MEDRDAAWAKADRAWRAATVEERKEALEAWAGDHVNASPFLVFMAAWGRAEQARKDWEDAAAEAMVAHAEYEAFVKQNKTEPE